MRIEVYPIDFIGQGALLEPADRKLHDMTVEYCTRQLQDGKDLNLAKFSKVWVAVELDGNEYKAIHGITGFVWRVDLPVFRVSGPNGVRATKMMADRLHSYFQDQGLRGQELFIHISGKETPEQRCEKWDESLIAESAAPADRFSIKI